LGDLSIRHHELGECYKRQGTRHELFYLLEGKHGPILVLVSELKDLEEGGAAFLHSHRPLDVEFKELIQEIRAEEPPTELLYDSAQELGVVVA